MRRFVFVIIAALAIFILIRRQLILRSIHQRADSVSVANRATVSPAAPPHVMRLGVYNPTPTPSPSPKPSPGSAKPAGAALPMVKTPEAEKNNRLVRFVLDNGLAVVDGDIVIGQPVGEMNSSSGTALMPNMHLWPTHTIPFHIQANLSRPERVRAALGLFAQTAVRFVPYTSQHDVLVFEESTGPCKSYVGQVGGKQPILLSPDCGSSDIAHEVMHALGFVHEQNRLDRDKYIQVINENIDEKYLDNFAKLPPDYMQISGRSDFAFESLMIYPPTMFAKGNLPTMESKIDGKTISPTDGLSQSDFDRINFVYGNR
jgi:hypothetical protein